ncbi:hypothetical protein [Nocardia asteroides]|uniref:hypothetical protein n=1 Tax=Nocardia asteroides TaxID=1824 RepID=UPI001E52A2C3|nr:hypothetical protein [Nocardia asteroides]UGT62320.1 hypothetical protein LTT61_02945 [Nocardia asteroides]
MNDTPAVRRAAVTALARLLGVTAERIGYLTDVPAADLAALRILVSDRIFGITEEAGLSSVAAATRLVPPQIAAKVATRNDSPLMTAHLAAVMEPARAAAVAQRLTPQYLARVATYLDLARSGAVIAALPVPLAVEVARELVTAADHPTLAGMLDIATAAQLRGCLAELDPAVLASAAELLSGPESIARVADSAPPELAERLRALLGAEAP